MNSHIRRQEHSPSSRQSLNDFAGARALERGQSVLQTFPVELHLQLTSTCNLDCIMCSEHLRPEGLKGRKMLHLDPAIFEKLEREVLPYSSKLLLGVGGEPMLSRDFFDFVRKGIQLNQEIHLTTNGTRITTDFAAQTLAECVSKIEISIDGATPETYERIRQGAQLSKLLENIERLNKFRLLDPPEDRCLVTICMVLMRSNVHELPLMIELAKELHIERVAAWHVIPVTEEGRQNSLLDHKELSDRSLREAYRVAARLGIEVDFPELFEREPGETVTPPSSSRAETVLRMQSIGIDADQPSEHQGRVPHVNNSGLHQPLTIRSPGVAYHCHMPTLAAYVLYDGRVFACGHPYGQDRLLLGDLTKSSFSEIWNGAPARLLRSGLALGQLHPVCQACSIMRSPPPELESLEGSDLSLAEYYANREQVRTAAGLSGVGLVSSPVDRAPVKETSDAWGDRGAEQVALRMHIEDLEQHAENHHRHRADLQVQLANLEGRLQQILNHPIHRLFGGLCKLKDRMLSQLQP